MWRGVQACHGLHRVFGFSKITIIPNSFEMVIKTLMRALELHASAKVIQRSSGRSSVAAAAYRSGTKLYDERTGITHDYTRKQGVESSRIYLPENAPQSYRDRQILWNAVEKKENRSNSCTARELEVAFPYEFNEMQRREAGDCLCRELVNRYGCAVDISYHAPHHNNDERNFHAHILFTDRAFDLSTKDGWAKKKYRDLSNDVISVNGEKTTRGKQEVLSLRAFAASTMNHIASRDNLKVKVEHLSFEAREIDKEPEIHLGSVANDMKKNGKNSERDTQNGEIIDLNKRKEEVQEREFQSDKFDEIAGAKRAKFQQEKHEMLAEDGKLCDKELHRLETYLFETYGDEESKLRAEVDRLQKNLDKDGITKLLRDVTGKTRDDLTDANDLRLSLRNIEFRQRECRDKLFKEQLERRKALENRIADAEDKLELDIQKARSQFKEADEEGKGDAKGLHVAKKVKRAVKQVVMPKAKKTNLQSTVRTTSYAEKELKEMRKKRLKESHNDAIRRADNINSDKRDNSPSHDLTPPKGPSLGR